MSKLERKMEILAAKLAQEQQTSLWRVFKPSHLKLHAAKQIIAYTSPKLAALLPNKEPTYPVTKLFNGILQTMKEMMPEEWHEDGNFERAVELLRKFVVFIAEEDGYYRSWLELFCMTLAHATFEKQNEFAVEDTQAMHYSGKCTTCERKTKCPFDYNAMMCDCAKIKETNEESR